MRGFDARRSIGTVLAPRATLVIFVVPVILRAPIDPALLKLRRHRSIGITQPIPGIDIGAVAAGDGISATAIGLPRISPRSLILRRQITVRVAEPIPGAEIP